MAEEGRKESASFQIRPALEDKFKTKVVEELIHTSLQDCLSQFQYNASEVEEKTQEISQNVRNKLAQQMPPKYKFIVHVVIGEQLGEGVKVAARCLWDSDADGYAFQNYTAKSFFCNVVVFGVYTYK